MNLDLKGKHALVRGGSHGIGFEIGRALASEGCNVAICARTKERINAAVQEFKKMGVVSIRYEADVLVLADISRTMSSTLKTWPTLHILVNNVGCGGRWGR